MCAVCVQEPRESRRGFQTLRTGFKVSCVLTLMGAGEQTLITGAVPVLTTTPSLKLPPLPPHPSFKDVLDDSIYKAECTWLPKGVGGKGFEKISKIPKRREKRF